MFADPLPVLPNIFNMDRFRGQFKHRADLPQGCRLRHTGHNKTRTTPPLIVAQPVLPAYRKALR